MYDQNYLKDKQYVNPTNLNARIQIHSLFSTGTESWCDFISQNLDIQENMHILALGCGNATQWLTNQDRFAKHTHFFLTDLSFGMILSAAILMGLDNRFNFGCIDSQLVSFADQTFDRVTANHMLYHVPDIAAAINEVVRVMKYDGLFIAATNGESHMIELYDLLKNFDSSYLRENEKHTRFSLENGQVFLRNEFSDIRLKLFESNLWVTNASLLSDYVYSMWDMVNPQDLEQKENLRIFFQSIIGKKGGIFIKKSMGIFLCSQG